jgi:hypothetical protein
MPELTPEQSLTIFQDIFAKREQTLIAAAAAYSVEELVRGFENGRAIMLSLLDGLTDDQARYSPDPKDYSISQILSHVMASQGNAFNAFLDLGNLVVPHIEHTSFEPGGGAVQGLTVPHLRDQLKDATAELIDLFRQAARDEHLNIRNYGFLGDMNAKSWLLFQTLHDGDHTRQARTVRDRDSFPRSESPVVSG